MENKAFTIMPMTQRFSLNPGETKTGSITIVNPVDADSDFEYKVSVTPYGVLDENYTADLATFTNRTEIVKWITIEEPTGSVPPNGSKEVKFTIKVPTDASAGGQYAAISVGSNSESKSSEGVSVQNVFEMASLVYAEVSGETVHAGEILENNVPVFSAVAPLTISALIKNDGNVHESATFVISVSNFMTGEVILPTEDNDGNYAEIIMPESERLITREINNVPMIGVVKINQTIYYRGDVSTVEKDVIICPFWFMILVGLTLLSFIAVIVQMIKRHHRKKHQMV